jgi:hypothetical protein
MATSDLDKVPEFVKIVDCIPIRPLLDICESWNVQVETKNSRTEIVAALKKNGISRDELGKELFERGYIVAARLVSSTPEKRTSVVCRSAADLEIYQHPLDKHWTWVEDVLHYKLTAKERRELCTYAQFVAPKNVTAQHTVAMFRASTHHVVPPTAIIPYLQIIGRHDAVDEIHRYKPEEPQVCAIA